MDASFDAGRGERLLSTGGGDLVRQRLQGLRVDLREGREGLDHVAQHVERLTGAYALGAEAGEWLQQATLAIRARVPLDVLSDVIQPFPTFSEIYAEALKALVHEVSAADRERPLAASGIE